MIIAHVTAVGIKNKIKGVLSRYMYRIDSNIFIWSRRSIIDDIDVELSKLDKTKFLVTFYISDSRSQVGIKFYQIGELDTNKIKSPFFLTIREI